MKGVLTHERLWSKISLFFYSQVMPVMVRHMLETPGICFFHPIY